MKDKHLNEKHGNLTIIASSQKPLQGYLAYYWCRCDCGNFKRYRYDQLRKVGSCGLCEDFTDSGVIAKLKELGDGKK